MGVVVEEGWDVKVRLGGDVGTRLGEAGLVSEEDWDKEIRLGGDVRSRLGDIGIVGEEGLDGETRFRIGARSRLGNIGTVGEEGWDGEIKLGGGGTSRLGRSGRSVDSGWVCEAVLLYLIALFLWLYNFNMLVKLSYCLFIMGPNLIIYRASLIESLSLSGALAIIVVFSVSCSVVGLVL